MKSLNRKYEASVRTANKTYGGGVFIALTKYAEPRREVRLHLTEADLSILLTRAHADGWRDMYGIVQLGEDPSEEKL